MALGTNHVALTEAATFIPEVWSDDVIAAYKQNLVMANLVTKINHNGKKGDTIHIPAPTRGAATAKAAETQVTLIANTESEITVSIDQHWEYSRLIEDIVEKQALGSMRRFYTDDAGYALATRVDSSLHALGATLQGGTAYSAAVIGSDGSTVFTGTNEADLTDAGIRQVIETLDSNDVPMDYRYLVIPPPQRNVMMGLARFTEEAFVGERGMDNTIRNGRIGNVYGVEVYVTNNHASPNANDDACLMFHKDTFVLAEQMGIRSQAQYKQEYLGSLYTADTLYGVAELRDTAGVAIATPD